MSFDICQITNKSLRNEFRSWQVCWLPGYEYRGKLLHAYYRWKRKGRYWLFQLNYWELDHYPHDGIFETALERVGPDLTDNLWVKHYDEFSREAYFNHGGWRWWSGAGLSEAFVLELRDLLIGRYARARTLHESWPFDPDYNYEVRMVPEEDPAETQARQKQEELARERCNAALAKKRAGKRVRKYKDTSPCPICGFNYVVDLASNRRAHRKVHAEYMLPRQPKEDSRLATFPPGDIRVDATSPKWLHQLVYERACALQHDEGYDSPQWNAEGDMKGRGKKLHALLLIENAIPIGAASFEWIEQTNGYPIGWHLNFVWVADKFRRQGLLSKRWPQWVTTYAPLTLEYPVSEAFKAFLRKVQYAGIHEMNRRQLETKPSERKPVSTRS